MTMTEAARPRVNPNRIVSQHGGRRNKLTAAQVDQMVIKYNAGTTQTALAKEFGVSVQTVRRYLKNRE